MGKLFDIKHIKFLQDYVSILILNKTNPFIVRHAEMMFTRF